MTLRVCVCVVFEYIQPTDNDDDDNVVRIWRNDDDTTRIDCILSYNHVRFVSAALLLLLSDAVMFGIRCDAHHKAIHVPTLTLCLRSHVQQ